jgi:hypothetical protein
MPPQPVSDSSMFSLTNVPPNVPQRNYWGLVKVLG